LIDRSTGNKARGSRLEAMGAVSFQQRA